MFGQKKSILRILYTKFCSHHYWRVWIRTHTGPNYGEVSWIRIRIIEQHFQLLDTYILHVVLLPCIIFLGCRCRRGGQPTYPPGWSGWLQTKKQINQFFLSFQNIKLQKTVRRNCRPHWGIEISYLFFILLFKLFKNVETPF